MKSIIILEMIMVLSGFCSADVTICWDANTEPGIAGYFVHYGPASRNYTNSVNVGNVTTNTVRGLVNGATYFFAVTAYNTNGLESPFSDEVSYSSAGATPVLRCLPPLLTQSNVTLRGTTTVLVYPTWFEYRAGADTNWTLPALPQAPPPRRSCSFGLRCPIRSMAPGVRCPCSPTPTTRRPLSSGSRLRSDTRPADPITLHALFGILKNTDQN